MPVAVLSRKIRRAGFARPWEAGGTGYIFAEVSSPTVWRREWVSFCKHYLAMVTMPCLRLICRDMSFARPSPTHGSSVYGPNPCDLPRWKDRGASACAHRAAAGR